VPASPRIPEVCINGGDRLSVRIGLLRPCGGTVCHVADIDASNCVADLVQGRALVSHGDHTWDGLEDGIMVAINVIAGELIQNQGQQVIIP
jgi:hypothetical protein